MSEQRKIIHDDNNGLDYVLVGDYYMPMLALPEENMGENLKMRMNQIIRIFMYLLQSVLLQKMGAGGTSRNGNMFWMKTETG